MVFSVNDPFSWLPVQVTRKVIYQLMQIKTSSSQASPKGSNQSAFSRYNLCFTYSNTKKSQSVEKKLTKDYYSQGINGPFTKTPTQSVQMPPAGKTAYSLHSHVQSSTFYPSRRQSWSMLPEEAGEGSKLRSEVEYIVHAFPQRRQKSGEHQLVKLLLKYSNSGKKEELKHPLFSENTDTNRGVMPRVKNFARLNWRKDRYRANRDREHGVIQDTEGFDSSHKTQQSQNSWLLRASLHPKKLF